MAQITKTLIGHKENLKHLTHIAAKNQLGSSYLFVGPQGVGKKLFAWAFIQAAMCLTPNTSEELSACGACGECLKVENHQHESVLLIEPQGVQIKINQAQEIHQFLNLRSMSRRRFVIIDNAQAMNVQTGNSLLKILEEPPADSHFILIAPTEHSVLKTLRSRSQMVRFAPIPKDEIKRNMDVPDWVLNASQGRFDLMQSLMSPEVDEMRQKAFRVIKDSQSLGLKQTFTDLKELLKGKESALYVIQCWMQFLRDIMYYKNNIHPLIHADQLELFEVLKSLPEEKIFSLFEIATQVEKDIYGNVDRVLAFENWTLELTQ